MLFLKNRHIRLIKMIDGPDSQTLIYAFYLRMGKRHTNIRIDLLDMMHHNVHHSYEVHRVSSLSKVEFCINQPLKGVMEFLFFEKVRERKQDPSSLLSFDKKYLWPLPYFKGFYQPERFSVDMENNIRIAFTLSSDLFNKRAQAVLTQMKHNEHAVSLHVCRGDYSKPKYWKTTDGMCQLPYYLNAITEMDKRIEQPSYHIFSDDIARAKGNLLLPQAIFINRSKGTKSRQDITLMNYCHHHIICNSTPSQWGVWLNPRENRTIIIFGHWFQHYDTPNTYPAGWIKVPVS